MGYTKLQASTGASVTPSDTTDVPSVGGDGSKNNGCVLYVGGTGALKVTTAGGSILTFAAVSVGFFPVQVVRVWSTGTDATDIIALW